MNILLKVNIKLFAEDENESNNNPTRTCFITCTINSFKELINSGHIDEKNLYFVQTNSPDMSNGMVPYLLFKGSQMVGNSSVIIQSAIDGIITINDAEGNIKINITDAQALSEHIKGINGQICYILNKNGINDSVSTYLYYWNADKWVNANLVYATDIHFKTYDEETKTYVDYYLDANKMKALLDLLV